jgi:hypothetical protein
MSKKLLSALLVGTVLTLSSAAHAATSDVFTGVDIAHNSWYAYLGGVTALSGQDISTQEGWLARVAGGYGQYDYNKPLVGNIDGDVGNVDLMVGYGMPISGGKVSAYLGANWTDHDLSPNDPANDARGSKLGVKGQLEAFFSPMDHVSGDAMASYSTAFSTYWSHFNLGYNFGGFAVGPEVGLNGNDEYNEFRYGAEVNAIDLGFASVALHGGIVASNRNGGDGGYGGIGFNRRF